MGWCFKIIEIWNLFDILDFVYWNFWFIQVRVLQKIQQFRQDCTLNKTYRGFTTRT